MWPDLIQKSKDGGLDVIETYVFWNLHEPVRGQVCFYLCFMNVGINQDWSFTGCSWVFSIWSLVYCTIVGKVIKKQESLSLVLVFILWVCFLSNQKKNLLIFLLSFSCWIFDDSDSLYVNFAVQLWGKERFGWICEGSGRSRALCASSNWALCVRRMELRVCNFHY